MKIVRDDSAAQAIKAAVTKYLLKKNQAVNHEVGLCAGGRLRADVIGFTMGGYVTVVEVKSCVQDLRTDKKFRQYLEFSNKLYFAFSEETYSKVKDELPKDLGIGIMVATPLGNIRVVQAAKFREMDAETQFNLAVRMVFRNSDFNRFKGSRKSR